MVVRPLCIEKDLHEMNPLRFNALFAIACACLCAVACDSSSNGTHRDGGIADTLASDTGGADSALTDVPAADAPLDVGTVTDAADVASTPDAADAGADTAPDAPVVTPRAELQMRAQSTVAFIPTDMITLRNGDYALVGTNGTLIDFDACVLRVNVNDAVLWGRCFHEITTHSYALNLTHVRELADGSLFAIGSELLDTGTAGLILRVGADGSLQSARRVTTSVGNDDEFDGIVATATTDLLITGGSGADSISFQPWVTQVGLDGSITWSRIYNTGGDAVAYGGMVGPGTDFTVGALNPAGTRGSALALRIASTGPIRTAWGSTTGITGTRVSVVGDGADLVFAASGNVGTSGYVTTLVAFTPATGTTRWAETLPLYTQHLSITPDAIGLGLFGNLFVGMARLGRDGSFGGARSLTTPSGEATLGITAAWVEPDGSMRGAAGDASALWMVRSPMNATPDGCTLSTVTESLTPTTVTFATGFPLPDVAVTPTVTDITSMITPSTMVWTSSDECPP